MSVPRAPQQDGAIVAVPPLQEIEPLLGANRRLLSHAAPGILGRGWDEMRRASREEVAAAARAYLLSSGEPLPSQISSDSLLLAGHQPELFHPGVWVKNFALHGLARKHGATPLNLVVDNDVVKSTSLRMPVAPSEAEPWPHSTTMAFDRSARESPWEERPIQDAALFDSFAERVQEVLRGWGYQPILTEFWPRVRAQRSQLLGERFAAARRGLERRWGCHNLEVPLSAICRTGSFAWFAAHLLTELPRFQAAYNDSVHTYRRTNRLKSRNHPVPDLAADGEWLEAPFWGWRAGQTRRGRLFARSTSDRLELRSGTEMWPALPRDGKRLAETWHQLENEGYKVRTRALTTTLYARLFLADLFIHGIGGGKYDELTDSILRRFYGFESPGFLILTATHLLPLPPFPATVEERRRLARELRDLHWNPQRYVEGMDALRDVVEEKRALMAFRPPESEGRRRRFKIMRGLNEQLRAPLGTVELDLRHRLAECDHGLEANAVLRRRDYSFCLYPEPLLRPFCTQFLDVR